MHKFTHEYTRRLKKTKTGPRQVVTYVGSRCQTEGCLEQRHRAMLPHVAKHNATANATFGRFSTFVQK